MLCGKISKMDSKLKFLLLNITAFLVMIYVNYLSVALPLGGNSQLDLSAKYENLFVPAGFTFSIWGVIYSFIFAFLIGQAIAVVRKSNLYDNIGYFFVQTCVLNSLWLVAWHYEYVVISLLIMISLLLILISYYLKSDFGNNQYSLIEKLQIHAPFSLYLGWISVATIANVTAVLVSFGYKGYPIGEQLSTIIMVLTAGILGCIMQFKRGDTLFGFVIIWATFGIYCKRYYVSDLPIYNIIYTCYFAMAIVGISILINVISKKQILA